MSNDVNERPANVTAYDADDETIDLAELLGVIIENRWLIAATTIIGLAIGLFNAFTAVPIYRADGLVQVDESTSGGIGNLEVSAMLQEYTPVAGEIEILRSRSVLGDVVDNLKLDISATPEYLPFIGEALARRAPASERPAIAVDTFDLPEGGGGSVKLVVGAAESFELFDYEDERLGAGRVGQPVVFELPEIGEATLFVSSLQGEPGQVFWVDKISRASAIRSLQGSLSVEEQGEWGSGILKVSLDGEDPETIRDQVNEIQNVYVRKNVERHSLEAQQTLDFLDEQLPIVRTELEAAEAALNSYRLEKGSIDLPLETQTMLQTIVSLESQINELRQQREKVTLAFTAEHPTVIALDRQILRLNSELDDLNAQVRSLPETQQDLLRLIRNVEVSTALYTSLLNTAQELRVVEAGTVGNVRVIDEALMPTFPVGPNRNRMVALALLLGGFVGVALAFARKALHAGVEDADLVEKNVGIPVYATISHSKRQDSLYRDLKSGKAKEAILAIDNPTDPAIESLRNLRTALHFGMVDISNNCVLIAGPSPSVGKSFVSVNLAAVLAANDKQVLLIDADLRRGHLHEYLNVQRQNGLSDYISGELPLEQAIYGTSVPGLSLVPTGTLPPNPAELLLHARFAECLKELGPRYDHIIIDSPPILAVTDAAIIGQMVGGALMVLKSGLHPMREIEQATKQLRQADVNLRGLIFNDIQATSRQYGAGRYHYQYSYKED